ncbi:MAG: hypothetical protein AB7G40_10295 [Hyphomonadaceae bacterium]
MWEVISGFIADCWHAIGDLTLADILANKIARAIGMIGLVLVTIWVIALVYSGYAQDSVLGPIAIRPHTNRRLGEGTVVFDQSKYPFQMDGVEATCQVFYQYEDSSGKTRRVPVLGPRELKMHIRVSPIPADASTRYGFEPHDDIGALPHASVIFPTFETQSIPDLISPTPSTVREYVEQNGLESLWTEDDEAPVISLGPAQVDLIAEARSAHIASRAQKWIDSQSKGLFKGMSRAQATRERANVFGSYYIKMQFSKRPDFVLFKHPNKELKMTAWLTLLTSFFSLAMDLWPVNEPRSVRTRPPGIETPMRGAATGLPAQTPPATNPRPQ